MPKFSTKRARGGKIGKFNNAKEQKPVTVNIHVNVANGTNGTQPVQNQTAPEPCNETLNETGPAHCMNQTQPLPQPQPVRDNSTEQAALAKAAAEEAAREKARAAYINSKISVRRGHPEIPITVHLMPYSYTMGQQYQNDQHKDQVH